MEKMASIMQKLRDNPPTELAGHKVVKVTDYKKPEETGLPAANVLIYALENGATVVVRPSGTEPKIKTYFTTLGKDLAEAQAEGPPRGRHWAHPCINRTEIRSQSPLHPPARRCKGLCWAEPVAVCGPIRYNKR